MASTVSTLTPTLDGISSDSLASIASYLDIPDLFELANVNKCIRTATEATLNNDEYWKNKLVEHFPLKRGNEEPAAGAGGSEETEAGSLKHKRLYKDAFTNFFRCMSNNVDFGYDEKRNFTFEQAQQILDTPDRISSVEALQGINGIDLDEVKTTTIECNPALSPITMGQLCADYRDISLRDSHKTPPISLSLREAFLFIKDRITQFRILHPDKEGGSLNDFSKLIPSKIFRSIMYIPHSMRRISSSGCAIMSSRHRGCWAHLILQMLVEQGIITGYTLELHQTFILPYNSR